jgi:hypothetical protein
MIASFSTDSTEDFGSLGPVGRSATDDRFLHLNAVLGLLPYRVAGTLRLSDYAVSLKTDRLCRRGASV